MNVLAPEARTLSSFMDYVNSKDPGEVEFQQAVFEFAKVVVPFIQNNRQYQGYSLMNRLIEPDRLVSFRVNWENDRGEVMVNRGYRVQFNNAIGPI